MQPATPASLFDDHLAFAFHQARKWSKSCGLPYEDCRQEALLALWRSALGYDHTRGQAQFRTFAWVSIKNRLSQFATKEFRQQRHHTGIPLAVESSLAAPESVPSLDEQDAHQQQQSIVEDILSLLTDKQRRVMVILLQTGCNVARAARQCNLSRQRINEVMAQARKRYYRHQLARNPTATEDCLGL